MTARIMLGAIFALSVAGTALAPAHAAAPASASSSAATDAVAALGDPLDAFRDPLLDDPAVHALRHEWLREHVELPAPRDTVTKADVPSWAQGEYPHFDVALELDPATGHVTTRTTLPVRAYQDLTSAVFTVAPLGVDQIVIAAPKAGDDPPVEHALNATYDENSWQLRVDFEPALVAGDELLLEITMSGTFDCEGLGGGIPMCGFSRSLSFVTGLPFFPTPFNEAELFTADLHLTIPDGYVAAANGVIVDAVEDGGFTTTTFARSYPGRYVVFSVGDYVRLEALAGDVPLSVYTFASDTRYAHEILDEAIDVVDFYSSRFSTFPYAKLDVVEMGDDFGGGFGPLQAIFMSGHVFRGSPDTGRWASLIQLQSHEIAHQWWGNFVGIGDNNSVVISEGMAEFSSAWHYETRKGSRSNFVTNAYSYMFGVPSTSDVAAASAGVYYSQFYVPIVYDKGSVVMDMLRWELGEDVFSELLLRVFAERGGAFLSVRDLESLATEVAGEDMGWFFDQWYFGRGYPTMVVTVRQEQVGANDWRINLRIVQPDAPYFRFTLPVYWRTADGEVHEELFFVDGDVVEYVVETAQPALTVAPDPLHRVLQVAVPSDDADVNLTGDVDGFDLLELAGRFGTGIIAEWNGHEYLMPDPRYEMRYDVDRNGRVDGPDRDAVMERLSWTTIEPD